MLRTRLTTAPDDPGTAPRSCERQRTARFAQVRAHSATVEDAATAEQFAGAYAAFSHWMLATAP
ncbi:hypothetical protein [Kitasatospora sp. NBC_01266]|uniref:hypothetical protein n=1 Tax=Kitasatospora sp. NBC_01266 TaxID=2903572 RepID=UPI002E327443|nr:hypothetical protein [Kitasatospora sp. NBC_01266]